MMLVALLSVLAVGVWGAFAVFAASAPPTPTISASPSVSPTSSQTEAFTYVSSGATSFLCKLDAAASFTTCANSGITYTNLAPGSHTFQVEAADKNGHTSSAASYTWLIDITLPTVSSLNRVDANPTKATALHWTVTFSEPVKNVATSNFNPLVTSNVGGTAPSITSVVPVGSAPTATWTVTVNATGATGTNAGSIQLNLTAKGTIQDAAGNGLGGTVPVSGQAYTFDTTRPTLTSITAPTASTRTNAASVSWTVTFGEPVVGLTTSNFTVSTSGITGTAAVTSVTGSGTTWTVTASTGTGTPSGTGSITLNFANATGVTDLAGNTLNATLPASGPAYSAIDHLAPPVAFGTKPPDPNSVSTSNFTWSSTPAASDFGHYECSTENGAFSTTVHSADGSTQACSSPLSYIVGVTNNGQHQFDLRAYDTTGNFTQITWTWKVAAGSIQSFTISGDLDATTQKLYPGGPTRTIPAKFSNPNSVPITVTAFTVSIDSASLPSGCDPTWFTIVQSNIPAAGVVVPPSPGSVTLPAQGATAPTIKMTDNGLQDACHGANFTIKYTNGLAHS
jgi:hypothetical protein